jgi:hypothetical protein
MARSSSTPDKRTLNPGLPAVISPPAMAAQGPTAGDIHPCVPDWPVKAAADWLNVKLSFWLLFPPEVLVASVATPASFGV